MPRARRKDSHRGPLSAFTLRVGGPFPLDKHARPARISEEVGMRPLPRRPAVLWKLIIILIENSALRRRTCTPAPFCYPAGSVLPSAVRGSATVLPMGTPLFPLLRLKLLLAQRLFGGWVSQTLPSQLPAWAGCLFFSRELSGKGPSLSPSRSHSPE